MELKITPRLQYIIDNFGETLSRDLFVREKLTITALDAVLKFAEYDPSGNKSATQWLIKTYLAKGFRYEDLSKAKETLQLFGLHRSKLEVSDRDLNQYISLSEVWRAIEGFFVNEEDTVDKTGKELKRADRDKPYSETFTLYEDDTGFKIVSPLTKFASCWWGRGTRWCTAGTEDNYFHHYNNIAPLFIIMLPTIKDGKKQNEYLPLAFWRCLFVYGGEKSRLRLSPLSC